ncbi:Crp/Fnr family transcriptional regulator [Coraliomargarita akajimensis]|uniref:Crp/Fnr family transcriptional regulator n=1 Tax=Coraliomargarita akajimensis TaxID=395922 RepID=UPI0005A0ABB7|nr:cyclic nucleotide-binding domain-containing protein [Coraliomargarita akajimensis]
MLAEREKAYLISEVQTQEEYPPGATILRQGDPGIGFYVLEKGSVEVFKDDLMLSVLMFPGTLFGELSYAQSKPRTCTIKARTPTVVTKYDVEGVETLIEEHPETAAMMIKTLAGRLERTTQKLADLSNANTGWHESPPNKA